MIAGLIRTSAELFDEVAADFIASELRRVGSSGPLAIGLSGGSTPEPVYELLATVPDLPWDLTSVYFADERCVPPDHPASNYRMIHSSLLARVPLPPSRIHRMEAERLDTDQAALDYEASLPERLDLLLLGLGEDGHTASLFPGNPSLAEESRRVVATRSPAEPRNRLTITPPVIRSARRLVVLVSGETKADAVRMALDGSADFGRVPGRLAADGSWILDYAAAGLIKR